MIKRICFFSGGFAFNRLVRMRFYEKIFPEDVEMFLFTTDKYDNGEKEKAIQEWDLKRTKVIVTDYHPIKTAFTLRKFCIKNKIDRIVNLGTPWAGFYMIIAALLRKTDFLLGFYGKIIKYKTAKDLPQAIRKFFLLPQYFFVSRFAKRLTFIEHESYRRAPFFFLFRRKNITYLHAPVNVNLFSVSEKANSRKKLNLPQDRNIIIRVGRVNYAKCGDILMTLIEKNPELFFVLIGEWFENEIPKIKRNNLLHIERKSSMELVDYYNAADLSFCLHRLGDSFGIVAEESLACGTPVMLPKISTPKDTQAIITTPLSTSEVGRKIKTFFSKSAEERKTISKEAREYAEKYCSDEAWKKEYINFHLT